LYCSQCGNELQKGARFCPSCGAKIQGIHDQNSDVQAVSSKSGDVAGEKPHDIQYFGISMWKLSILSMATFSLYEIYWFFKNWQAVARETNARLSPFWRSVFPFFFCNDLFKRVVTSARSRGYTEGYSSGWLTFAYFVISAMVRLPNPFWLVSLLSFIPLLTVQRAINFNNSRVLPNGGVSDKLSTWEIVLVVVGAIVWVLVLIGSLI